MSSGQPVETATTIRYPATSLLCVNSSDGELFDNNGFRVNTTNPSDLYINKQRPLMFGYMTRISLVEMNIQWSFENVHKGNNTMSFNVYNASGVFQGYTRISIPVGFYTAARLGSALQTALNANTNTLMNTILGSSTFTVLVGGLQTQSGLIAQAGLTLTASSSKFTIVTSSLTGFFEIIPSTKSLPALPLIPLPGLPALSDDLTDMMGLTPTALQGLPFYTQITGGFASCMRTPYIDVISQSLTTNQQVKDGTSITGDKISSILSRIYLSDEDYKNREITITYSNSAPYNVIASTDNAFGIKESTFRREFKYPKQIQWDKTENIDFIDLRVVDFKGNILEYAASTVVNGSIVEQFNTSDFQFTIQITEN